MAWKEGVSTLQNDSKVFDLNNWKDGVAIN